MRAVGELEVWNNGRNEKSLREKTFFRNENIVIGKNRRDVLLKMKTSAKSNQYA